MTQAAKAQEPSMEEILASIRRIIADDEPKPAARPEPKAFEPPPAAKAPSPPPPPPKPAPAAMKQDDIDAMLAGLDEAPEPAPPAKAERAPPSDDVLELTEAMQAQPEFRKIDATQDVVFDEAEEAPRAVLLNGTLKEPGGRRRLRATPSEYLIGETGRKRMHTS